MAGPTYATSWVDICNRALSRLGKSDSLITDLNEGTTVANYCTIHLPEAIEDVYGAYDWTSAKKRVELARLTSSPAYGYSYGYQLPTDFIRFIEVDANEEEYSIEGDAILSDATQVYLTYIARPTDVAKIPGPLKTALVTRLTFLLTPPLTSNEQLAARTAGEYTMALEKAKADDARGNDEETQAEAAGYTWYDELR